MATLQAILGGILRDITAARATADSISSQYSKLYAADPLLALIPSPRVNFREVRVQLRFAVESVVEEEEDGAELALGTAWLRSLTAGHLAELLSEASRGTLDRPTLSRAISTESRETDRGGFSMKAALAGRTATVVNRSIKFALRAKGRLSPAERRKLPNNDELSRLLKGSLTTELNRFLPRAQGVLLNEKVRGLAFNVLIDREGISQAPEGSMQELSLVVSMEDLERLVTDETSGTEG
jgi:hypothetical protein